MDWKILILIFVELVIADTEYLLDTSRQTTELSRDGWSFPNNSKWQDVNSLDENGDTIRVLQVCAKTPVNDNWAISPFISTKGARNIDLEIKYTIRSCESMDSGSFCREKFSIFLHQTSEESRGFPSVANNGAEWRKVDTVASGEEVRIETISIGPIYDAGIYLAFQDTGSCMQLMHVKVSYKYCPAVTAEFGSFPRTHTGSSVSSIINQPGKCVLNSRSTGSRSTPTFHCGADGKWILNSKSCQCKPGYKSNFDRTECISCFSGYFKNQEGIGICKKCPENSISTEAAAECSCIDGFFRTDYDSVDEPCQALPEAVQHVRLNRTDSALKIQWDPPRGFSRYGSGIRYRVSCLVCGTDENCQACPKSVQWPQKLFSEHEALISNLSPQLDYKLHIKAESGISEKARSFGYDSEPVLVKSPKLIKDLLKITNVEILEVSSNRAQFRVHLANEALTYDGIEVLLTVNQVNVKREFRTLERTFPLDMLQGGTSYSMKIRVNARGRQMNSNWSEEIHFRTTDEVVAEKIPATMPDSNQWIAGVITGVILLVILLIVIALVIYRRKTGGNQWMKGTRSSIEQFSVVTTSSAAPGTGGTMNGTVDLIPCGRPNVTISAENYVEIPLANLTVAATMRSGRLGKVNYGTLYNRSVSVKQLLMSNEEYLNDMKIFSQFEHVNLMRIEGFVTQKYPNMIVMERLESNLITYVEQRQTRGSVDALAILRDLTNGLSFLHQQRFILRHLDLEHVMVNSGTLPPIFKIRLSSKYEHEPIIDEMADTSRYNNFISIRHCAPECFGACAQFTQESDIWSFGILMWTICSNNMEEPYWGLTIRQVVDAVTSGWRLPVPNAADELSEKRDEMLHRVMLQCWDQNGEARPNAKELRYKIEQLIQAPQTPSPGIAV